MKMFFRVSKFLNKRFGVVPPDKIRAFYDDYHRYLRSQGVHGVKVDAQSVVRPRTVSMMQRVLFAMRALTMAGGGGAVVAHGSPEVSMDSTDPISTDRASACVPQVNFIGPGNGGSVMLTRAFHSALSKSVRKHFVDSDGEKGEGGRIIHCMCHDSEILLQVGSSLVTIVFLACCVPSCGLRIRPHACFKLDCSGWGSTRSV